MKLPLSSSLAATLCIALPTGALAQSSSDADDATESPLQSIVVIGTKPEVASSTLAGSVDIIGRDELEYQHVDDTMELLSKVPGTYLSRFNQGIINSDVSIRGFAGDGSTPHVKLLIDGIPSNLHAGYSEMDQLFPMGLGSVQVFKGTSDARYGLYNIAGNYSLATRADAGVTELEATLGSYDSRELQVYSGIETGQLTQNYFAGFRESQGYRDHTDLQKYVASGRWAYAFAEDITLALILRTAGYEGDSPGYLSRLDSRAAPRSSAPYAALDGGDKQTTHASLHFDAALAEALRLSVQGWWQRFERERWVRFSAAGSLQNRHDDERQTGLRASLAWDINEDWKLTVGTDTEHQRNLEQRFGTLPGSRERNPSNIVRNNHFDFETRGGFAQIDHQAGERFSWNAAVRVDRLSGELVPYTVAGAGARRRMYDFGSIVQPKLNLFFAAHESVTLFANYGRSFQHPFGAAAYTTGPRNARDVSLNDGGELGLQWRPAANTDLRVSYWQQQASDEFVTVDGTPRNVGETDRAGFDVAASWQWGERLSFWGSYTRIESEIVEAGDALATFAGNELRSIPDYTATLGANFKVSPQLTLRARVDSQGDYYVNEANLGGQYGDYTLVGLSAEYQWDRWDLSLQLNNVFDEYYEYVFDFSTNGTDTIHSPGDGRNVSLSIGTRF